MNSAAEITRAWFCACLMLFATCSPSQAADTPQDGKGTIAGKGDSKSATPGKGDGKKKDGEKASNSKGSDKKGEPPARTGQSSSPAPVQCPPQGEVRDVRVTAAYKLGTVPTDEASVKLRDSLVVKVENLTTLLATAACATPPKKVVLFLNGRPIDNVSPFPPTDPNSSELRFPLRRDEKSREAWTAILGYPTWAPRATTVSVGVDGQYALQSDTSVQFEVIPHGWFGVWVTVFLAIVVFFFILAGKSDVLRDSGANPGAGRRMYSLSRVQAAYWFFLILASYLFLWLITGDYSSTITGTVLVLTGISAATTLGASAIDAGAKATAAAQNVTPPPTPPSNNWWTDIVSDANGVSFHRFQMAVWTLVLGIMFIISVYRELAMPTFNETLLGLLGISAGTYLGMKTTETK